MRLFGKQGIGIPKDLTKDLFCVKKRRSAFWRCYAGGQQRSWIPTAGREVFHPGNRVAVAILADGMFLAASRSSPKSETTRTTARVAGAHAPQCPLPSLEKGKSQLKQISSQWSPVSTGCRSPPPAENKQHAPALKVFCPSAGLLPCFVSHSKIKCC